MKFDILLKIDDLYINTFSYDVTNILNTAITLFEEIDDSLKGKGTFIKTQFNSILNNFSEYISNNAFSELRDELIVLKDFVNENL